MPFHRAKGHVSQGEMPSFAKQAADSRQAEALKKLKQSVHFFAVKAIFRIFVAYRHK